MRSASPRGPSVPASLMILMVTAILLAATAFGSLISALLRALGA